MELADRYDDNDTSDSDFAEDIDEYILRIYRCSNRSQAIKLRTQALRYIDQWRIQQLELLDECVRQAGQAVLNAFDDSQDRQQVTKNTHRSKQVQIKSSNNLLNDSHHRYSVDKIEEQVEIFVDRLNSSSSAHKKIAFNSIDFGRDFTFETLAHLSSPSSTKDIAMVLCEKHTLVYSQQSNELNILSLDNNKRSVRTQLEKNVLIRDLCYVDWLSKCIVIADDKIYLLDYRTTQCDMIDYGVNYVCGTVDNLRCIFYLIKHKTLYKYDKSSLETLQADQYPIADGYDCRRIALDNQTNDHLALLVLANDEKNYILVYSTASLADGYLYKIMIDDRIEREWICSSGNHGWLVRGSYPGSSFDLNKNGLGSMFMYNGYSSYSDEIQRHSICNSPLSCNVPSSVAEKIAAPYLTHIYELIVSNRPFSVTTDKDFKWTLEIFAFGFTCEESAIYQLCANVYVEWLKVFENSSTHSNSIPPILRDKT
ncbi:unnamed protein product, partial [Adineta ricciae]